MSLEGLEQRLTALQDTTSQLRELIDRLANLKFQPGSVPINVNEEDSVSGELSIEIGHLLKDGEEEAELLVEEVEFLRPEGDEKAKLRESVERVGKELKSHRLAFRRARLAAKKNLAQAQRLERELILQSYAQPLSNVTTPTNEPVLGQGQQQEDQQQQQQQQIQAPTLLRSSRHNHHNQQQSALSEQDKQTVTASTNVTNALRQTHSLIQSELERSEFARQTLEESSLALRQLTDSYGSLEDMLTSTKKLLGTLVSSQKSDTWYLQTTFYLLVVTAGWLIFRRLLYGPLWWLVWLPLRLVFGVGSKAVGSVGGGKGKESMGLREEGVVVDGIPGDELPTAKVGGGVDEKPRDGEDGEKDPVREQVEKMIEKANEAEELGNVGGDADELEVVEVGGDDTRPRDEL